MTYNSYQHAVVLSPCVYARQTYREDIANDTDYWKHEDASRFLATQLANSYPSLRIFHRNASFPVSETVWSDANKLNACLFSQASRIILYLPADCEEKIKIFAQNCLKPLLAKSQAEGGKPEWHSRFIVAAMGNVAVPQHFAPGYPFIPVIRFREINWIRDVTALMLLQRIVKNFWLPPDSESQMEWFKSEPSNFTLHELIQTDSMIDTNTHVTGQMQYESPGKMDQINLIENDREIQDAAKTESPHLSLGKSRRKVESNFEADQLEESILSMRVVNCVESNARSFFKSPILVRMEDESIAVNASMKDTRSILKTTELHPVEKEKTDGIVSEALFVPRTIFVSAEMKDLSTALGKSQETFCPANERMKKDDDLTIFQPTSAKSFQPSSQHVQIKTSHSCDRITRAFLAAINTENTALNTAKPIAGNGDKGAESIIQIESTNSYIYSDAAPLRKPYLIDNSGNYVTKTATASNKITDLMHDKNEKNLTDNLTFQSPDNKHSVSTVKFCGQETHNQYTNIREIPGLKISVPDVDYQLDDEQNNGSYWSVTATNLLNLDSSGARIKSVVHSPQRHADHLINMQISGCTIKPSEVFSSVDKHAKPRRNIQCDSSAVGKSDDFEKVGLRNESTNLEATSTCDAAKNGESDVTKSRQKILYSKKTFVRRKVISEFSSFSESGGAKPSAQHDTFKWVEEEPQLQATKEQCVSTTRKIANISPNVDDSVDSNRMSTPKRVKIIYSDTFNEQCVKNKATEPNSESRRPENANGFTKGAQISPSVERPPVKCATRIFPAPWASSNLITYADAYAQIRAPLSTGHGKEQGLLCYSFSGTRFLKNQLHVPRLVICQDSNVWTGPDASETYALEMKEQPLNVIEIPSSVISDSTQQSDAAAQSTNEEPVPVDSVQGIRLNLWRCCTICLLAALISAVVAYLFAKNDWSRGDNFVYGFWRWIAQRIQHYPEQD